MLDVRLKCVSDSIPISQPSNQSIFFIMSLCIGGNYV